MWDMNDNLLNNKHSKILDIVSNGISYFGTHWLESALATSQDCNCPKRSIEWTIFQTGINDGIVNEKMLQKKWAKYQQVFRLLFKSWHGFKVFIKQV